jgi:hypothetical protein
MGLDLIFVDTIQTSALEKNEQLSAYCSRGRFFLTPEHADPIVHMRNVVVALATTLCATSNLHAPARDVISGSEAEGAKEAVHAQPEWNKDRSWLMSAAPDALCECIAATSIERHVYARRTPGARLPSGLSVKRLQHKSLWYSYSY